MDQSSLWNDTLPKADARPSFGIKPDLEAHLDMLATEFAGSPLALFYHAALSVMLRRKLHLGESLQRFFDLWDRDQDRLTQELNSRWLVSAMDSFVDHGRTPAERATALSGTLFMNTIKLYETERFATGQKTAPSAYQGVQGRVALDDGMSAFVIGHGDMVFNLVARVKSLTAQSGPTGAILHTLLARARAHDTVFQRFALAHQRKETAW